MLMLGDLDLNSVPRCTETLKEAMKLTMLEQEVVFRKQVHELHRLYNLQESVMKDLTYPGRGGNNSPDSKEQSFLLPLANLAGHEPLAKEARFLSVPKEGSKPLRGWEFLEECQGAYCEIQQRSFDHQLSADEFINHVKEHQTKKGNDWNHIKEPAESGYCLHVPISFVPEELNLSLSIDEEKTRSTMATSFRQKISCCSQRVIDMEALAERMLDGYPKYTPYLRCVGLETNSKDKLRSQVSDISNPIILTNAKKDSFHQIARSDSFQQHTECCQEQTFSSNDLNSASGTTEISTRISNCSKGSIGMVSFMGPDSRSRHPIGMFECIGRCSSDHENVELGSNPGNIVSHKSQQLFIVVGKASGEKNVEYVDFSCNDHSQIEVQDQQGNISPASCKSYSISVNSGKTAHSCITTEVSNQYSRANIGSQGEDVLSCEHDLRLADSCDLKTECSEKKEESAEVDTLTQQAAESLVCMSLDNSACYRYSCTKAGSRDTKHDKKEHPQYSFDSFELFTLQLTEANSNDDSASSKQLEVNDEETKHFGLKWRRGRRLKDFQREILPGLVCLSVHEICEDINIMEGALRSREYRKTRAKMGNIGENWSPLGRRGRSRRNYAIRSNSSRKLI